MKYPSIWLVFGLSFVLLHSKPVSGILNKFNTVNTRATPKVILIGNSTFQEYMYNQTYNLTKLGENFKLRCDPDRPTQWLWQSREYDEDAITTRVIKERTKNGFISELEVELLPISTGSPVIKTNFSCSWVHSSDDETHHNWNASVTCILLENDPTGNTLIRVKENTLQSECFKKRFASECDKGILSLDTQRREGACKTTNNTKNAIGAASCADLDSCASLINAQTRDDTCKEGVKTLKGTRKVTIRLVDTKFNIVYCIPDGLEWSSYVLLYPTTAPENWTRVVFVDNLSDAIGNNSVVLYSLHADENFSLSNLNKPISEIESSRRTGFAYNETVEFVCTAVEYVYMKGFRFQIGGSRWNETIETDNQRVDSGKHITRTNITFKTNRRDISWISCSGPVWNSNKWTTSNMTVTLSDPFPPRVELHQNNSSNTTKEYDIFLCSYEGWPRPTIKWTVSNESVVILNTSSHIQKSNHSWYQTCHVKKLAQVVEFYLVVCTAHNFKGNDSKNLEVKVPDNSSSSQTQIIIMSSISVVCLILVIAISVLYWRYRKKLLLYNQNPSLTLEEIDAFYSGASYHSALDCEALLLPYNSDYEIPRAQLLLDDAILGSGQFGLVLKGSIGPLVVAVKTVKQTAEVTHIKALLKELKILQFVGPHRNIVNLIGAITENIKDREVFIILDFCANGSLINLLRQCRDCFVDAFSVSTENDYKKLWPIYQNSNGITLSTGNLITFACEIATAMDHISSKNVIHGDLAARNVLITEDLHAKVCDFGLAKQLLHYSVYVQKIDCPLPLRWMALESLQDMEFSVASDKWSLGIVLWEIFSLGELPYPGVQWGFESYKMLQDGYRMSIPNYANDSIYRLMLQCWNVKPQERPSYSTIIKQLKKEEETLT